jgi:hypothetical protein
MTDVVSITRRGVMIGGSAVAGAVAATSSAKHALAQGGPTERLAYVGCYTPPGEGIVLYRVNADTGAMTQVKCSAASAIHRGSHWILCIAFSMRSTKTSRPVVERVHRRSCERRSEARPSGQPSDRSNAGLCASPWKLTADSRVAALRKRTSDGVCWLSPRRLCDLLCLRPRTAGVDELR